MRRNYKLERKIQDLKWNFSRNVRELKRKYHLYNIRRRNSSSYKTDKLDKRRIIGVIIIAIIIAAASIASFSGVAKESTPQKVSGSAVSEQELNEEAISTLIHQAINRERGAQGIHEIKWSHSLARIAKARSEELVTLGNISQPTALGDLSQRYLNEDLGCTFKGENVLVEPTRVKKGLFYDFLSQEELAEIIVRGWMSDPDKGGNLFSEFFEKHGISVVIDKKSHKVYIAQNFCG